MSPLALPHPHASALGGCRWHTGTGFSDFTLHTRLNSSKTWTRFGLIGHEHQTGFCVMPHFIALRAVSVTLGRKTIRIGSLFTGSSTQREILSFFFALHNVHLGWPPGRFINSKSKGKKIKNFVSIVTVRGSIMESVFRCYQDNNSAMAQERGTQLARRG